MDKDLVLKWLQNLIFFTAPAVAVLFGLMAQGVQFEKAWPVALLALYGAIADLAKKVGEQKKRDSM